MIFELLGDSADYELLTEGVKLSAEVEGMTCEIGLRQGGGSKYIIDAIAQFSPGKHHIAIDPYGHIPYEHKEGHVIKLDYTNDMKAGCLSQIYRYAQHKGVGFDFFCLEDTEFFTRFDDGVPTYNDTKTIRTKYSFVHFDGPHAVAPLLNEIEFFKNKIDAGACFCFDDVIGYYDHEFIEKYLFSMNFKLTNKTAQKALYQYIGGMYKF